MNRILQKVGSIVCVVLFVTQVKAQITAPLWDTALGTYGGAWQNGIGIKAGFDNHVYASFRYSNTINLNPVSPASGCGTAVGIARLTNRLKGLWGTRVQQSCGYDYNEGFNIDYKLNCYAVGIISSGSGWFCGKTDMNGNFKWDFTVSGGSPYASGVCADNNGNAYICGGYGSTMTVGSTTLTYLGGGTDGFFVKLDSNKNVKWAVRLAGTGNDCPTRCAMDYSGHIWVCGGYSGIPTFGTITLPASSTYSSLFVAEYDTATGNCLKVYTGINCGTNGIFNDGMVSMLIDSCNNMYLTGPFQGTAQWGTFTATNSSGANFYLAKMQPNGAFQWVQTSVSSNAESGYSLTMDKNWDITTTGMFTSSASFSGHSITGSSSGSTFAAKYASGDGSFMYATAGGGTSAQTGGSDIGTDLNRQVYIIGSYYVTSPTFGTVSLPWGGDQAIFIAKLDSTPNFSIIPSAQSSYCQGQCYTLPISVIGTYTVGNVFTAQLSDKNGSFASGGITIGTLSSTSSGTINICIPDTLSAGSNYLLRVTSSAPHYSSIVRCNSITINPAPTVTTSGNPTICKGDSAVITTSGGVSYTWSTGASTSSITAKPTTTTTYSVNVSNGTCSKDTTVTVTVNPSPALTFTGTNTICKGDSSVITASGGTSYTWSNGATSSSITVKPSTNTTYSVSISNGTCTKDSSFAVTVNPLPSVTLSGTTTICSGKSTMLTASGGVTYSWSNGATTSSITVSPTTNTTYSITVSNGSCNKDTSITVTVNPSPTVTLSGTTTICSGKSTTLAATGGVSYSWSNGATTSSITVSPVTNTTYSVSVSNGSCSKDTSITITVNPTPLVTLSGTTTICSGKSTTLAATGGVSYSWSNGATTGSITVSPLTNITYSVSVSNGTCNTDTSITVTVNPTPSVTLSGTTTVCAGKSTTLTASGGTSYTWSNGATTNSITVTPATNTTYSVSVSNGLCSQDTSMTVIVNPLPTITLSGNTGICPGDSTTITASGGTTYTWSNGATTSSVILNPAATTTYTVQVDNGCIKDTTITITVAPKPSPTITPNQTICAGNTAALTATGGTTYNWSNGATNNSITVTPTVTTTYSVSVSNGGCPATDSSKITVIPMPVAAASGSTTITSGQSTPLVVTPGAGNTYLWAPASSLSCDTCTNPVATPTVTTWYYVTITDSGGCSVMDSVLVIVKEKCGPIYLPNAFSPNGDGWNDVLYVMGNCIKEMDLSIYDRWGDKIFESTDPHTGWDGTYKGEAMNSGTYVFILTATDIDNNTITRKGNITLVR